MIDCAHAEGGAYYLVIIDAGCAHSRTYEDKYLLADGR
jgi:hypothetical protein